MGWLYLFRFQYQKNTEKAINENNTTLGKYDVSNIDVYKK